MDIKGITDYKVVVKNNFLEKQAFVRRVYKDSVEVCEVVLVIPSRGFYDIGVFYVNLSVYHDWDSIGKYYTNLDLNDDFEAAVGVVMDEGFASFEPDCRYLAKKIKLDEVYEILKSNNICE